MYFRIKRIKGKTILCSVKMYYIYVIWARNEDDEEVRYYGHTHDMEDRKTKHTNSYNAWVRAGRPDKLRQAANHACRSVFVMDMGDWNMDVLHELDCDEEEASLVEGNYIRHNKCVNRKMDGRTRQQYHQDNKEMLNAGRKQRHQANRDKENEYHRQRHQANRDKDNENAKAYHQANKETISARKGKKVPCKCGEVIRYGDMARHHRSQKHAKRMQQSTSS